MAKLPIVEKYDLPAWMDLNMNRVASFDGMTEYNIPSSVAVSFYMNGRNVEPVDQVGNRIVGYNPFDESSWISFGPNFLFAVDDTENIQDAVGVFTTNGGVASDVPSLHPSFPAAKMSGNEEQELVLELSNVASYDNDLTRANGNFFNMKNPLSGLEFDEVRVRELTPDEAEYVKVLTWASKTPEQPNMDPAEDNRVAVKDIIRTNEQYKETERLLDSVTEFKNMKKELEEGQT